MDVTCKHKVERIMRRAQRASNIMQPKPSVRGALVANAMSFLSCLSGQDRGVRASCAR